MTPEGDVGYIAIVGWDELTHRDAARGSGPLPWVRSFTRLMQDDAYLDLTPGEVAVYHRLLLVYASSNCRLRADTRSLTRRLALRVTSAQLASLNHAGFIRFCASTELAESWHAASPRDVRDRYRERDKPKDVEKGRKERPVENLNGEAPSVPAVLPPRSSSTPALEEQERLARVQARIGKGMTP